MSWLDKILPPKIKIRSSESASSVPEGLWHKCPSCSATIYSTELKQNVGSPRGARRTFRRRLGARASLRPQYLWR